MFPHGPDIEDLLDSQLSRELSLGGVVKPPIGEKAAGAVDQAWSDSDFYAIAGRRGGRQREETEIAGVESTGDVEEWRGRQGGEDGFFGDGFCHVCFGEGNEVGFGEGWEGHFDDWVDGGILR